MRSPRILLAMLAGAAIVVAALLVVLSQLGSVGEGSPSKEGVGNLYSGISQEGTTLGESNAPVTVYLYEDFQCPFCGQFSRETFPEPEQAPLFERRGTYLENAIQNLTSLVQTYTYIGHDIMLKHGRQAF